MSVLLAKANLLRRAAWATETLIVERDGELRVVKRRASGTVPAPPASSPLGTLAERHARLTAAAIPVALPRILGERDDELHIEYVDGESSLARLERCLYERRLAAALAELTSVLALLDAFPTVLADPYADAGFVAAFDPRKRTRRAAGPEPCLLPGLYDFGLGNLLTPAAGGPRVLVDWEWAFPWPVPTAFVRFVIVRNTAEYLQALIRALTSEALPGLVWFDDVVIPETWSQAAGLDAASVARFLALEVAFQDHVHLMHRPLERFVLHAEPRRVADRQDVNGALLTERLQSQLADERSRADALDGRLRGLEAELAALRRSAADLSGVRHAGRHLGGLLADRALRRTP